MNSVIDANSQTSSFTYNDGLKRLTRIDYPDTGWKTFTYNESSYPYNLVTSSKINGSTNYGTKQVVDGWGQVTQSQITSAPGGIIKTDTTYGGLSRVRTVSNPYISVSEPTSGTTTYDYDVSGRVTTLLRPSRGSVTTAYGTSNPLSDGTYCTTVTDEQSKSRQSCSDALGRLLHVFEAGSSYETTCQYDALGNLTRVDLKGGDGNPSNWRLRPKAPTRQTLETPHTHFLQFSNSGLMSGHSAARQRWEPLMGET